MRFFICIIKVNFIHFKQIDAQNIDFMQGGRAMSKFNDQSGGRYWENYFNRDQAFNTIIQEHLMDLATGVTKRLRFLDIGAGPGCGAMLLFQLGIKSLVVGYEPSDTCFDGTKLAEELDSEESTVTYISNRGSLKSVYELRDTVKYDVILLLRSAHEIAESMKCRRSFLQMLGVVIGRFLKTNGTIIVAEPQYSEEITSSPDEFEDVIALVRQFQEETLGHSHHPSEYIPHQEMCEFMGRRGLQLTKQTIIENSNVLSWLHERGTDLEKSTNIFYCMSFLFPAPELV